MNKKLVMFLSILAVIVTFVILRSILSINIVDFIFDNIIYKIIDAICN